MREKVDYGKRLKGLLAFALCFTMVAGVLRIPMEAEAVSQNLTTVSSSDTQVVVGQGDRINVVGGKYSAVFSDDNGPVTVVGSSGSTTGTNDYGDSIILYTDGIYEIGNINGVYVARAINYFNYDGISERVGSGAEFTPAVEDSETFVVIDLVSVEGWKIDYMDDNGAVAHTEYQGLNSEISWNGLTKENAELIGWSTSQGSATAEYEVGATIQGNGGLAVLYPVWEVTAPEPEPEPEPEPVPPAPAPKSAGIVNVSMNGYTFGGNASNPMIVSSTNDVSKATVTYKAVGASDATYSTQKPTVVGDYVVRVALPENDNYGQAVGTANFRISYLPAPTPAYELDGTKGDNGWYKSEVEIAPPDGYEMSVGNRDHFTTESYTVDEETSNLRIYLRKIATGEMTDVISIANLRVDADAPTFTEMQDGEEYYEDSVTVDFTDRHFKTVTVNGEVMEVVTDENGEYSFAVETGMRRMSYVIVLKDEAGNETKVSLIFGPAWLKDGIVGEGDYYLETGEEYHFPTGSGWVKSGDTTVYAGGSSFYANSEGEVTFGKE